MINTDIKEEALSWILKEKEGLSKDEYLEFEDFLSNSIHQKYYDKYKNLFNTCNQFDTEEMDSIEELISKDKKKRNLYFIPTSIAASVILVMFMFFTYIDNTEIKYKNIYATQNEKNLKIILPDETIVDLDAKSKIDVKYYKNERLVNFSSGKVLFEVAKNKNRPFIIKNKNAQIEVLGTKFEVININDTHTINVIEGVVRISYYFNNKVRNLAVLKKGQSFSINEKGKFLNAQDIDILNIASWKDDLIKFENTTLKVALLSFARYSDLKFTFTDYDISQIKISGIFNVHKIESLLSSLPFLYPLDIKREKNHLFITSKQ